MRLLVSAVVTLLWLLLLPCHVVGFQDWKQRFENPSPTTCLSAEYQGTLRPITPSRAGCHRKFAAHPLLLILIAEFLRDSFLVAVS
jgi:hypothetical protein